MFFVHELSKEVSKEHFLNWKKVTAIAKNAQSDDVLFSIEDSQYNLVVVHLTYSKENSTDYPLCDFYKDFLEFHKRMLEDWQ
jgi:hypothetical protein